MLREKDTSLTDFFFFVLCDFRMNVMTSILQKVKDVVSVYVVQFRDRKS